LALTQNIGFTGGTIQLGSDFLLRHDFLNDRSDLNTRYTTTPVRLSLSQPLNRFNQFRWAREIEPLRFEEAKLSYIIDMENIAARAVREFFGLAIAQVQLNMAETNLKNRRELYDIAQGRFQSGLIAEDALLQVELTFMQAELSLIQQGIDVESSMNRLRTFLGFREGVEIELVISPDIPDFKINPEDALNMALTRNPDVIAWQLQVLNARQNLARIRSLSGVTVRLDASFGLNVTAFNFADAYYPPVNPETGRRYSDRYGVGLRVNVPILDWGQQRNRNRNAQATLDIAETRIQQAETDFRQNVYFQVMSFNLQENQLRIAALSDTIAQRSYEIAFSRYMLGRGDIIVLNNADRDKDDARVRYMNALQRYWNLYYTMRQLTLFDFSNSRPLEEDFDRLLY
jgi:outer membrane protein TolC